MAALNPNVIERIMDNAEPTTDIDPFIPHIREIMPFLPLVYGILQMIDSNVLVSAVYNPSSKPAYAV